MKHHNRGFAPLEISRSKRLPFCQRQSRSLTGFTLVELLVYTAIFAIVAGLLTTIFYTVINTQKKTSVSGEVSQQLNLVLTTVQRLVGDASLVEAVYEGNNPSSPCTTFCTLKLRRTVSSTDPTIISSNATGIYLQEGASPQVTLTTNKVLINHFRLTKQEIPGGHAIVEISTSFSYNTQNPTFAVTRAIESAIARVNAATFDADLLPNQDNTFDVGQVSGSSLRWRNGRFSGDLTVGGQITISGGSPSSGKVLTSDASGVGSWQVGGVGWAASSTNIYNTNSGNVGIGTTNPSDARLSLFSANNTLVNVKFLKGSQSGYAVGIPASGNYFAISGNYDLTSPSLVVSGDNVGIGTTSPGYPLSVTKVNGVSAYFDGTATDTSFWIAHGVTGGPSTVAGIRTNSGSPVLNAKSGGTIYFNRDVTSAEVEFQYNSGASTALYIKGSDGNVGIGTAAPGSKLAIKQNSGSGFLQLIDTNATPNYRNIYLYANTSLMGFDNGSNLATLTAAGVWTDASDISYKENISSLDYGLDTILQIQPKRYNMKVDGSEQIGFIAQEIEPVVPEIVSGADGNKNIAYGHLTPILANAIKELNQKVDAFTQGAARVVNLVADRLTVGSSEKPTGITIFDKETRDPYCLEIVSGSVKTSKGECQ